ncbi:hypothetical protein [Enterococcus rotai]|uniref:hypothetical protein n=1 Tax=Enterococcus rotai TaxID=118060 RepID=UPI0035C7781A
MDIQIHSVKQYNGPKRKVLSVDGIPIAIARSRNRLEGFSAYLQGYHVEISDKKIKKSLDQIRRELAN